MSSMDATVATAQQPGSENPAMVQLGQLVKALDLSQEADQETLLKTGRLLGRMQTAFDEVVKQNQILQQEVLDLKSALGQVFVLLKTEQAAHAQNEVVTQEAMTAMRFQELELAKKLDTVVSKDVFEAYTKVAEARIKEAVDRAAAMQEANRAMRQELDTRVGAAQTSMEAALQAVKATAAQVAVDKQERDEKIAQCQNGLTTQITALANRVQTVEGRIGGVEGRTGNLEQRVGGVEGRVGSHSHPVSCELVWRKVPGGSQRHLVVRVGPPVFRGRASAGRYRTFRWLSLRRFPGSTEVAP